MYFAGIVGLLYQKKAVFGNVGWMKCVYPPRRIVAKKTTDLLGGFFLPATLDFKKSKNTGNFGRHVE